MPFRILSDGFDYNLDRLQRIHDVRFEYRPTFASLGFAVTGLSALGVSGLLVAGTRRRPVHPDSDQR